jgi:hypothetical protein
MTAKSVLIDDFNLHAANMRRPGVAAPFCPPTADEMPLDDTVRSCIDTLRFNCRRSRLNDFSKDCLSKIGFTFKGTKSITLKNGSMHTRSIWARENDGFVIIESSLYGLSIQFSPPRVAFGRNDRQADVDHAGIAPFVEFIVTKVLGDITDVAMQRLADEESRRDMKRVHDICWAHVWRPTRLDAVVHCWLSDKEIEANPRRASDIIESVRYARQGLARKPPFVYSASACDVTESAYVTGNEADLAENNDFEYATRELESAEGDHKLAIGVATKKTGSSRRQNFYDKGYEQACKGMTAERLVKGQVIRYELTLLSQDLIRCAQLLSPEIHGQDSAFYLWPKGMAPVAIGLPTGGLLRLLYDELDLLSTRMAMGVRMDRLSDENRKAHKATVARLVNAQRGKPGFIPMTVWRDFPALAADAMRKLLGYRPGGKYTPLTRLFFPDGPPVHGIRTIHEKWVRDCLKTNGKVAAKAAQTIERNLSMKRKSRGAA